VDPIVGSRRDGVLVQEVDAEFPCPLPGGNHQEMPRADTEERYWHGGIYVSCHPSHLDRYTPGRWWARLRLLPA
jgi:hypothetical protein